MIERRSLAFLASAILVLLSACRMDPDARVVEGADNRVLVWHSYAANSAEEAVFDDAVAAIRVARPDLAIEVVRLPFSQIVPQFITASQGGEAPDIVRLADSHLTQVAHITVNGVPLLEDLRPHLRPADTARFDAGLLRAMTMDNALYALPASQGTMSLLYNPELFAAHGIAPPTDTWTIDDLVATAEAFEGTGVEGFAAPLRWGLWVIPFMTSYGGDLFDETGDPRFAAPGMAEALELTLGLERERGLVTGTGQIDSMKTRFVGREAAMIIEGAWNVEEYRKAGIAVEQALLPVNAGTGLRMRPLNSVLGWAISAQSANKPAAADIALALTADDVQRAFLRETLTLPTSAQVEAEAKESDDPLVAGFARQTEHSTTIPMRRGVQQVFIVIDTAIQLFATQERSAQGTLEGAEAEMKAVMAS